MTKEERAMLREAAEKWQELGQQIGATLQCQIARANYSVATQPAAILSLLDALDGAERDAADLREALISARDYVIDYTKTVRGSSAHRDLAEIDAALSPKESHD